jgi:hypothetical protein
MNIRYILVALLGVALSVLMVSNLGLGKIKESKILTPDATCVSNQTLMDELKLNKSNFFTLNESRIRDFVLNKYICIQDVKITKLFPQKLEIEVTARQPLVRVSHYPPRQQLQLDSKESSPSSSSALLDWSFPTIASSSFFLIDHLGVIFDQTSSIEKPVLFVPDRDLQKGKRLDQTLFSYVGLILSKLSSFGMVTIQGKIDHDNLLLDCDSRIAFRLSEGGNVVRQPEILRQIASLQLILQKAKIENKKMTTIDLRFDKPVVVYSPQKK